MLEKTQGIVLKTHKYSETSLICKVFTRRFGLLSFMVPGARNPKRGRGNLLQPGQLLELDCYVRGNRNFQRFREFRVAYIPRLIHTDMRRLSVLIFLMELTAHLVSEQEVNAALFDHMYESVMALDSEGLSPLFPVLQLLAISDLMGFMPANDYSPANPHFSLSGGGFQAGFAPGRDLLDDGRSLVLHRLLEGERVFSRSERLMLLDDLLAYFALHVPGFRSLRSQDVLHDILS